MTIAEKEHTTFELSHALLLKLGEDMDNDGDSDLIIVESDDWFDNCSIEVDECNEGYGLVFFVHRSPLNPSNLSILVTYEENGEVDAIPAEDVLNGEQLKKAKDWVIDKIANGEI